jgi:hypothetical protein
MSLGVAYGRLAAQSADNPRNEKEKVERKKGKGMKKNNMK